MPLFLSEEEFSRLAGDASAIADKADAYIREVLLELDTFKANSDASAITAEQTCSLIEHKYMSLSSDFRNLQNENASLSAAVEQGVAEVAELQAEKNLLHKTTVEKDGQLERLSVEVSELEKSKRQLLQLLEQKDAEILEKSALIQTYFDKFVNFRDEVASKEAKLCDSEAELARSQAANARLLQEKELIERHNTWLDEEMTSKVDSLVELRKTHRDYEIEMSTKLAEVERQLNDNLSSLSLHKDRVRELENKLTSIQEELCVSKEEAVAKEERFTAEISTVSRLAELYKESAEEWSRKAGDLEAAIKALEKHLNQVENDYKEKLEREISEKEAFEKEAVDLKAKLKMCEAEIENSKKANKLNLTSFFGFQGEGVIGEIEAGDKNEDNLMLVPKVPSGVSSTALAASLLRDGWGLTKLYENYQEAVDALRHERIGRKHSEAILERVLLEVEEKAEIVLDERVEHERMVEAYNLMDNKLQQSLSEHAKLEHTIRVLKADLRRMERDYDIAQKEISDLQKQITILLKECQDIQLRCGGSGLNNPEETLAFNFMEANDAYESEKLTFKDINGLVEQNVQLQSLVRTLSDQNGQKDVELREKFEIELQKLKNEAAEKVEAVLKRSEEQGDMIEALHSSVSMYKKLYEEELKNHSSSPHLATNVSGDGRRDVKLLIEGSNEEIKKAQEKVMEHTKLLEEELEKSRNEATSLRMERDRLAIEAKFGHERLEGFKKEVEQQREKCNSVDARNAQFSQLIVDHQKKLRESADLLRSSEERTQKLSIKVSRLEHERDVLSQSEKRALDEVRSLSERVHRLQVSLNTAQSTEEVRESARAMEKKQKEEYAKQIEREWAEAKKELQEERDHVRTLTCEKEEMLKDTLRRAEQLGKEKEDALQAVNAAETRASAAEARCSELEGKIKLLMQKNVAEKGGEDYLIGAADDVILDLQKAREEIEILKEEGQANKDHMLKYKHIAQVKEAALEQIESAHEKLKAEADKLKESQEAEILVLRARYSELERHYVSKSAEVSLVVLEKQEALSAALTEINCLKEENAQKVSQHLELEVQISSLKEDLNMEHQRWQTSQKNYERQVILQSETIQELTKTSQELSALQSEVLELRKVADTQRSENDTLKTMWETEKIVLEKSKSEAEKAYIEINEQNKILHNHLEALHIKLAEKDRSSARTFSCSTSAESQEDSNLQVVINYLRRSKEIGETEISLLKQEKLRMQSQLDSALKASEKAQALLYSERASSRPTLFSDEEFKILKLQVNELNLLRESNMQLREESKHNFEECQNLREVVQKAKTEIEHLSTILAGNDIEISALKKEAEMRDMERANLENRFVELLAKTKSVDVEEYEHMKDDFQKMQIKLKENEAEIVEARKMISSKQEFVAKLEQDLANSLSEKVETEKKLSNILQSEVMLRAELDKQRKVLANSKKKIEVLSKEKDILLKEKEALLKQNDELASEKQAILKEVEDLNKEKQTLSRQIEDLKTSKKTSGDASSDHAVKEKDAKIQVLEKHLEREKLRRQKTETSVMEGFKSVGQEKDKVLGELQKYRHAIRNLVETGGISASLLSSEKLDETTKDYFSSLDKLDLLQAGLDSSLSHSTPAETSTLDVSAALSGLQVPVDSSNMQSLIVTANLQPKLLEEKEKRTILAKPGVEVRKTGGRKLVRPRLEQSSEPTGDLEVSETDGANANEERPASSSEPDSLSAPFSRKRLYSSSVSELRGESHAQLESISDPELPIKKLKGSDSSARGAETEEELLPFETISTLVESDDTASDVGQLSTELAAEARKDEEIEMLADPTDELKEQDMEDAHQNEMQNDTISDPVEVSLEKTTETVDVSNMVAKELDVINSQNSVELESDREDGEVVADVTELQGGDASATVADHEGGDTQGESAISGGTVDALFIEVLPSEEKIESGEVAEDTSEASDKTSIDVGNNNDGNSVLEPSQQSSQAAVGAEGSSTSSLGSVSTVLKSLDSSTSKEKEEEKEVPGRRIVHLGERARENAVLRQAGRLIPTAARGRGRASGSPRARGRVRGGRIVRGRESGNKEH